MSIGTSPVSDARLANAANSEQHHDERQRHGQRRRNGDRLGLAGCRQHFGGRRFAGGQRRGERIAAGQRRSHRERRRRPAIRIALQAAQDHALDGRIEIAHDRRGHRDRARLVQLLEVAERLGVVRRGGPVKISNRINPSA